MRSGSNPSGLLLRRPAVKTWDPWWRAQKPELDPGARGPLNWPGTTSQQAPSLLKAPATGTVTNVNGRTSADYRHSRRRCRHSQQPDAKLRHFKRDGGLMPGRSRPPHHTWDSNRRSPKRARTTPTFSINGAKAGKNTGFAEHFSKKSGRTVLRDHTDAGGPGPSPSRRDDQVVHAGDPANRRERPPPAKHTKPNRQRPKTTAVSVLGADDQGRQQAIALQTGTQTTIPQRQTKPPPPLPPKRALPTAAKKEQPPSPSTTDGGVHLHRT